jgi:hypothetical protein
MVCVHHCLLLLAQRQRANWLLLLLLFAGPMS